MHRANVTAARSRCTGSGRSSRQASRGKGSYGPKVRSAVDPFARSGCGVCHGFALVRNRSCPAGAEGVCNPEHRSAQSYTRHCPQSNASADPVLARAPAQDSSRKTSSIHRSSSSQSDPRRNSPLCLCSELPVDSQATSRPQSVGNFLRRSTMHRALAPVRPSARRQQGMLYLLKQYCTQGGCGRCPLS